MLNHISCLNSWFTQLQFISLRGVFRLGGLCVFPWILSKLEASWGDFSHTRGLPPSSLTPGDCTARWWLWHHDPLRILLLFICQVEVLEGFQEQAGDSRQLNTAVSFHENCFSWLSPSTVRLPRENAFGFTDDVAKLGLSWGCSGLFFVVLFLWSWKRMNTSGS